MSEERPQYHLRLYIAAGEPNSILAEQNLQEICEIYLQGHCLIEVIDVLQNPEAAHQANVVVTPTLIVVVPEPKIIIFGNLGDRQKVLEDLRLIGGLNER